VYKQQENRNNRTTHLAGGVSPNIMTTEDTNPVQRGILDFAQNFGDFTHLGTFTFAVEQARHPGDLTKRVGACYSQKAAMKVFHRFIKRTNEYIASGIYFTEPNPSRAGHHLHALLKFHDRKGEMEETFETVSPDFRVSAKAMWRAWYKRYGRNRVEPIRNKEDVEQYVTKHCAQYASKHVSQGGEWWWACNDPKLWKQISQQ
jgi:hypothetical protein